MRNEPVVSAAGVAGAIAALLMWLRTMGWLDWSDEQQGAFMSFVTAWSPLVAVFVLPMLTALWARARVRPLAKMSDAETQAMTVTMKRAEVPQ